MVIGIISILGSIVTVAVRGSVSKAENVRMVSDVSEISKALEQERLTDFNGEYPAFYTMPSSLGDSMPDIPQNNTSEDGTYSWFSNIANPDIYCLWAELGTTEEGDQKRYFIANQFGSGYFESEPESLTNCGYYVEDSEGSVWHDSDDTEEEDPEIPDDNDKVLMCHTNKKGKRKTILVAQRAVQKRLAKGATLGACN